MLTFAVEEIFLMQINETSLRVKVKFVHDVLFCDFRHVPLDSLSINVLLHWQSARDNLVF